MKAFPDALLSLPHQRDVPFIKLTTLGVGGVCHWLFEPTTEAEAQIFIKTCAREGLSYRILGGGANLLVMEDIQEPVLRLNLGAEIRIQNGELEAPASHGHILLAEKAAAAGLSGLEWASGIPGRLGGAVRMNAGAHGGEWVKVLSRYRFLTPEGEFVEKAPEPGEFKYRWSHLCHGELILSARARLTESDPLKIRETIQAYKSKRAASQPKQRSAGCFFKNPPGTSAGRLIDTAGLKGLRVGDAQISLVHANFLVNLGQADPVQVRDLMEQVCAEVKRIHGITLETEVQIWP